MSRMAMFGVAGLIVLSAGAGCGAADQEASTNLDVQTDGLRGGKKPPPNDGGTPGTDGSTPGATAVSGIVQDIDTGAPLAGVTISDGALRATTDATGAYSLAETAGDHTLTAAATGYLSTNQVVRVSSGSTSTVHWALTRSYGSQPIPASNMSWVVLAWNDLGMHCDQDDYSYFMVLPPFNTLHAQVFPRGADLSDPVTSGVTVSYYFPKKTDSTLHTNFWDYASQYGFQVPPNVGITGTPLAGDMKVDSKGVGFVAEGIPITPYDDDGTWDPYGTAVVTVKDASGKVLQTSTVVAPVSTEMACSNCHGTTDPQLDILQKHDARSGTTLVADHDAGKVHACAECHQDNALGAPGKPGVSNLSLAMHRFHQDKMKSTPAAAATTPDCYNCHPGPKTQCMRGIMARAGKSCADCHGDMAAMTNELKGGRRPWIDEPTCGGCHGAKHSENPNTLYRESLLMNAPNVKMNGKLYCEACHNSTHAELVSANPADPTISRQYQGDSYWIWNCNVCHSNQTQKAMHR